MNKKNTRKKTFECIASNQKDIVRVWNEDLKYYPTFQDEMRFSLIYDEQQKGADFLSLLLEIENGNPGIVQRKIDPIVRRIQTPFYSVTDFSIESFCLETAIDNILIDQDVLSDCILESKSIIRKEIFTVSSMIIKKSISIYEYAVENGKRAFCYFDEHGNISYCNKAMLMLMGVDSLNFEKTVTDLFVDEDKKRINKMMKNLVCDNHLFETLEFKDFNGNIIPVGGEISPVVLEGKAVGGYVSLLNLSQLEETKKKVYDKSPIGIIRVNRKNMLSYANPAAQEMFGVNDRVDIPVKDFFVTKNAWKTVKNQLKSRLENGKPDEYEVEARTIGDRPKSLSVKICGIPEMDFKGNITGSLAIIHNLEIEKATAAIHEKVETFEDLTTLFEDIGTIVNRVVPFRMMIVSHLSSDSKHVKSMRWIPPENESGTTSWPGVWWPIHDDLKEWLFDRNNDYIEDLEAFLNHETRTGLKGDPAIQLFLKNQFSSMIRCPVIRNKKLIASLSFFRRNTNAFNPEEMKIIRALPLHKAILVSRYEAEKNTLEFRLNLINQILDVCNDLDQVGQIIVDNLVDHYKWQNASFFLVDKTVNLFKLKGQKALNDNKKSLLNVDYTQPFTKGILGQAYKHKKTIHIPNVESDQKYKKYYVKRYEDCKSELCIPIIVDGKVFWILNIEDNLENAFCRDDIDSLEVIIKEVGEILKRAYEAYIHKVTLNSTSDLVITTDCLGRIYTVNPAAEKMLKATSSDLKGKSLCNYFNDSDLLEQLKDKRKNIPPFEAQIINGANKEKCVLLSSSPLPDESGGRVFVAKDLSLRKKVEKLEYLNKMAYEVALQTKTPLSLMFSWLGRLDESNPDDHKVLVNKLLNQLRKIELTTDRLALFEEDRGAIPYNELVLDFKEVIQFIKNDFPESDIRKINFKDENTPLFRGDLFQIKFCMESILSYLLRYLPRERQIDFITSHNKGWVQCKITGFIPSLLSESKSEMKDAVGQTLKDIALGERIIQRYICKNHRGDYKRSTSHPGQFTIKLPLKGA